MVNIIIIIIIVLPGDAHFFFHRFGRDTFEEATKLSNKSGKGDIDWSKFRFMIFDIPNHGDTYGDCYHRLRTILFCLLDFSLLSHMITETYVNERVKDNKYLKLAEKVVCRDAEHLEEYFQEIIDKGGEGVILRDPLATYQPGRSSGYLKHKVPPDYYILY